MRYLIAGLVSMLFAPVAAAQLTSGVPGPVIDAGHAAAGYRAAFEPDTDRLAHRVHYERASSGQLMWRAIAQFRKADGSGVDFDYLQGELRWQVTPDGQAWQSGLRFDARLRDDSRPEQVAIHWLNQWRAMERVRVRLNATLGAELGAGARDGIDLQTRAEISRRLEAGPALGLEMYNRYGSTSDLPALKDQVHQAGLFAELPLAKNFTVRTSALAGLSDASPDATLRVFLSRTF